jgi:PAS domain S-box-containing protein
MSQASCLSTPPAATNPDLLRALVTLGPRLHRPEASSSSAALYTLVCDTLRACGLFALIARLDPDGALRITATSLTRPMIAAVEALIGDQLLGSALPAIGPYKEALATREPCVEEDGTAFLALLLPEMDAELRDALAQRAEIERGVVAPIIAEDMVVSLLTVWGTQKRLTLEDTPAVAALAAQVGIALENARLLQRAETEHARWRAMVDSMVDLVVVCDAAGHLTHFNASAVRLLGEHDPSLTPEAQPGAYHLYHPGGALYAAAELPLERARRTGLPAAETLIVQRGATGTERQILWSSSPIRGLDGTLLGAVAVGRDATRQRLLEEQNSAALQVLLRVAPIVTEPDAEASSLLIRLAETLSALAAVDSAHAMLVTPAGRLTPLAIYGIPSEAEIRWRETVRAFDPATYPHAGELIARFLSGQVLQQHFAAEDPIVTGDFVRTLHLQAAITAPVVVDGQLVGLLTIGRARSPDPDTPIFFAPWDEYLLAGVARLAGEALARARLTKQLTEAEAARRAAEETARQRGEFLSIASHELRTPLTSIKASVQLAKRRLTRGASAAGTQSKAEATVGDDLLFVLLDRAERQIGRLTRLVEDFVDTSRIQAQRLELRLERCDLRDIVREAVDEQRDLTSWRQIKSALPEYEVRVRADADRITQVVTNYLTNALKHSPEDRPVTVAVTIDPSDGLEQQVARVAVHDEGPGIPPEALARLFERFYRVPGVEVQSGSGVGLGLGLYINCEIVTRHGGEVGVESAPGEGATFWFTMPLAGDAPST